MKTRRPTRLATTIVALALGAASAGGCASSDRTPREAATNAFADLRREINAQVVEESQRGQLLSLTDELEGLLEESVASRRETGSRIKSLNANYDSTEAEFTAALVASRQSTSARQAKLLELQSQARALSTDAEWTSLAAFRAIALEAAANLAAHPDGNRAEAGGKTEDNR